MSARMLAHVQDSNCQYLPLEQSVDVYSGGRDGGLRDEIRTYVQD